LTDPEHRMSSRNSNEKLTDQQVAELRAWHAQKRGMGKLADKARELGVSVSLVERIVWDPTYRETATADKGTP
jgi:hypothetical protein